MKHMFVVSMALAMMACAKPPKAVEKSVDFQSQRILDLEARLAKSEGEAKSVRDAEHWSKVTIDELQHDCGQGIDGKASRYPVTTAPTPEEAIAAVNKAYVQDGIEPHDPGPLKVKTVRLQIGEHYPDVICFTFGNQQGGTEPGKTCFDPMELTER